MLTYEIIVNHGKDQTATLSPVKPSDPEYKEVVLTRQMRRLRMVVGDRVKLKGTPQTGVIDDIVKDPNQVNWNNNRPHFIVVRLDGDIGGRMMCTPQQLKKWKNRVNT
jgi:hypothetical protein